MLTKEELQGTYLKYSKEITEEVFNKIIDKLCDYYGCNQIIVNNGKEPDYKPDYKSFSATNGHNYLFIQPNHKINEHNFVMWGISNHSWNSTKKIQVSDILGEDWNTKEKQYDYEVVHCNNKEEWDFVVNKLGYKYNFLQYEKSKEYVDLKSKYNLNTSKVFQSFKNNEVKIYSFQEWCDKFNHKPDFNESKFEIGKWYKYGEWYLKFKQIDNGLFQASEYIDPEKNYSDNLNNFNCGDANNSKVLLEDLSEIQQYLPDNHPDKIKTDKTMDKNELLAEAKRRYPIGCKVICINGGKEEEITSSFIWNINEDKIKQIEEPCTRVYNAYTKKWAKIISKPEESKSEFKEGDYIVLLNTPIDETSFPRNYVFKQREDYRYLLPKIDANGSTTNGWSAVKFDGSGKYSKWRYATEREIQEYDNLGKPYDVTTLDFLPKSEFKFEIGDIIDIDENGYQYTNMDKLSKNSKYTWEVIKDCNCKTRIKKNCKILDKVYSSYTKSCWYEVDKYNNWISENCMSLSNKKEETPKKWSIGTYVVIIKPEDLLTSLNKGEILTIEEEVNDIDCIPSFQETSTPISIIREEDGEIKWFATYDEAEEFSKELLFSKPYISGVDPYDEFVLPDKWKVKYDKNTKPLLDKWKDSKGADMDYYLTGWCISDSLYDNSYMHYGGAEEYTEITFEQFKKYVYDKEVSKEPFIKGYSWEGMSDLVSTSLTLEESFKTTEVKQLPTKSWV